MAVGPNTQHVVKSSLSAEKGSSILATAILAAPAQVTSALPWFLTRSASSPALQLSPSRFRDCLARIPNGPLEG